MIAYAVVSFAMVRSLRNRYELYDSDQGIAALGFLVLLDCVVSLFWPILPIIYVFLSLIASDYATRVLSTAVGSVPELAKALGAALSFILTNAAATSMGA